MRRGYSLMIALASLPAVAAAAAKHAPSQGAATAVKKLVQSCDAHKFETSVDTVVDGEAHRSNVKLCGVEGQSDAEWIGTLRDAVAKLNANKEMPAALRDKLIAAIYAEIARLEVPAAPSSPVPPRITRQAPAPGSVPPGFAQLPPLPEPSRPRTAPSAAVPPLERSYSTLPPLPVAPAPQAAAKVARIVPSAPRLKIECFSPEDAAGSGPCTEFTSGTVLTISAAQDVPPGIALEFVRNGRAQAKVDLGGLKRSRPIQVALPRDVCAGFGAGRIDLHVISTGGGDLLHSDGPYPLRC